MSPDSADKELPSSEDDFQWRMDLEIEASEVVEEGEDGATVQFAMQPNSERYEFIDSDEKTGWYDRFDNVFLPKEVVEEMWTEQMEGTPMYHSPNRIEDFDEYCSNLLEVLSQVFASAGKLTAADPDDKVLQQFTADSRRRAFVVLKADLVASTDLSIRMNSEEYIRLIQAFEYVIVDLIRKHNGYFLGKEGDAVYGFFPTPNLTGKHDNAATCSERCVYVINNVLNTVLSVAGYPEVQASLAMDSGRPEIIPSGEDSFDLMGLTMNLVSKIEEIAKPDEVVMGEITERNLHTQFRKHTTDITSDREWSISKGDRVYRIYTLNRS
jgi:class 3 adenylate cyclase